VEVIPVIDLKGQQAVRAKMGDRHLYAPIETPLAKTSAARDVIAGFLSLAAFSKIYVADLDAIEGQGSHADLLDELHKDFPGLAFWADPGVKSLAEARAFLDRSKADLVIGSETWQDAAVFEKLRDDPRIVLSLDFRGDSFQGPQALLDDDRLWPRRLIVMTLARVGSDAGPDRERLEAITERAKTRAVYAAGGLRGKDDLHLLEKAGAAGVLVASALHDGRLGPDDLIGSTKKGEPESSP